MNPTRAIGKKQSAKPTSQLRHASAAPIKTRAIDSKAVRGNDSLFRLKYAYAMLPKKNK